MAYLRNAWPGSSIAIAFVGVFLKRHGLIHQSSSINQTEPGKDRNKNKPKMNKHKTSSTHVLITWLWCDTTSLDNRHYLIVVLCDLLI